MSHCEPPGDENARRAWQEWSPVVERVAKSVAAGLALRGQLRCDFLEAAEGHVYQKRGFFNPLEGTLEAWCYAVLRNYAVDLARKRKRMAVDPDPPDTLPDTARSPMPGTIEAIMAAEGPLSKKVLDCLVTFSARQRVIFVALAGWTPRVHQVSASLWKDWLKDATIAPPFPPDEIWGEDEPTKRFGILAGALGMTVDAVKRHWYLGRMKLRASGIGPDDI